MNDSSVSREEKAGLLGSISADGNKSSSQNHRSYNSVPRVIKEESETSPTLLKPSCSASAKDDTKTNSKDADTEAMTDAETEAAEANNTTLLVAFLAMLVFQLGNRIYGRLMTYPMHNYPNFLNMLAVFMYVPMCFVYVWPMLYWGSSITAEQKEIPKFKFAVMGAYDSIAGIMQSFAVNYISNAGTIVLVQQSAIPISMAISVYTLGAKYSKFQYTGAAVVLLGIAVVLVPQLMPAAPAGGDDVHTQVAHMRGYHGEHSGASVHSSSLDDLSLEGASGVPASMNTSGTSELMWIFILVVSCVPMVMSSVYKEKALGEMEIDVIYLNGWVAVFQFLMSIPLIWPSSWAIGLSMHDIYPNMIGGFWCWLGVNTITEENYVPGGLPVDHCEMAPMYVNMYLFFNVVFNILIVVILKHGSSNILWLSSTIIVPMSNIAFSMKIMPGHQDLTDYDIIGLVVIMKGLIIYRFWPSLASLLNKINPCAEADDEFDDENVGGKDTRRIEKKQARYIGLGQIEALSALTSSRIQSGRTQTLFRSPQQIRSNLLMKLGIPPSPHISMMSRGPGPGSRPGSRGVSRGNSFIELKPNMGGKKSSFVEGQDGRLMMKPRETRNRSGSIGKQ